MGRIIVHLDLDAFFCAVEEQLNPELIGIPFAVGAPPQQRGVVASCSYPARLYGVRSAMPMATAVRLCPDLRIVKHSFGAYREKSRAVMQILERFTPFVEQISIDEAFLDVSLLGESGSSVAERLQLTIRKELGLPCSLGVSTNKLVAKIANNIGKQQAGTGHYPNAITIVNEGDEAGFLAPLRVTELWGIGEKTAERLRALGIQTIGQLASYSLTDLLQRFGRHGQAMWQHAQGIDKRPVQTEHETKSISKETTFAHDITQRRELEHTLRLLSDQVGQRLRDEGVSANTVKIKIRWSDFTTLTRQVTLDHSTHENSRIFRAASDLFDRVWRGQAVRLIGVGVSNFEQYPRQLGLWDTHVKNARDSRLEHTLDDLRHRYGGQVMWRASDIPGKSEPDDL